MDLSGDPWHALGVQIFELSLDFVRSMLWPGVALTAILLFKSELSSMLSRVKNASWGDARVELVQAEQTVEALGAESRDGTDGGESNEDASGDSVRMTRTELQNLVESFARAGWATGAGGATGRPPIPIITWDDSGAPSISRWAGVDRNQSKIQQSRLRFVQKREARLLDSIRDLERQERPSSPNEAGNYDTALDTLRARLTSTKELRKALEAEALMALTSD